MLVYFQALMTTRPPDHTDDRAPAHAASSPHRPRTLQDRPVTTRSHVPATQNRIDLHRHRTDDTLPFTTMTSPATPPPPLPGAASRPAAYTLHELAAAGGVTTQTIHFYVKKGLLARPKLAGPSTRYVDEHFVRLRVTRAMKRDGAGAKRKLSAIAAWMATATPDALVRAAGLAPPAPPSDAASPAAEAASSGAPTPASPTSRLGPYRGARTGLHERWERVAICPGVELHVRVDADPEALRVAREIEAGYAIDALKSPG